MAQLVEMRGENFAGFRSFSLPLAKQGLVMIVGENRDSSAASSNGACKSGLFKALGWAMYGEAVDGVVGDLVIHHGEKSASVAVEIVDDSGERHDRYVITRERSRAAPRLLIEKNGHAISGAKTDLQRVINELVGVDWEGFRNTVLYAQSDRDRFCYPTTKDSERKEILHRILRTEIFAACHAEAKRRRREVDASATRLGDAIAILNGQLIAANQDLTEIEERAKGHARAVRARAAELRAEALDLLKRARAIKPPDSAALKAQLLAAAKALKTAEQAVPSAQKALDAAAKTYSSALFEERRIESEMNRIAGSLEDLDGEICPVCEGTLISGHGLEHKRQLQQEHAQLEAEWPRAKKRSREAGAAEREADEALTNATQARNRAFEARANARASIESAKQTAARVRDLVRNAKEKRDEIRRQRDAENPHEAARKGAKASIARMKKERAAKREELNTLEAELGQLEFWVRGFSGQGIPSFALDSVMPFLTTRANHYLATLADGDISVEFRTQRELKSGEVRDEIEMTWHIEGIEGYPPSGGQLKKIEIATNFALMDLVATREGSHVNLLCLDECLDGLDVEGRQRVISLLHSLRSVRESVFVISHDADLAEAFERTVKVVKEDGVSRVELPQ